MRNPLLHVFLLLLTVSFCGCGAAEPGSTVEDDRAGGEPTQAISEDPNEVANQMGGDYQQQNK